MKRSTSRILTTHTGSLPRSPGVQESLRVRETQQQLDQSAFEASVRDAVTESFGDKERRQVMTRSTNAFRVLIKTLLHAGIITDRTKEVYARFVDMAELAREPGDGSVGDEVASLAYDTTLLVLSKLRQTAAEPFDPVRFRDDFSNSLRVGFSPDGPLTRMVFAGYENTAEPTVFRVENGKVTSFPGLGFLQWLPHKSRLRSC